MKAFVTGASGFIGTYLVRALVKDGCDVLCLKRKTSDVSKLDAFSDKIGWVDCSEAWQDKVRAFKPDIIYHLAWNGVSSADRIIWSKQVSNIAFQQELLDLAKDVNCKKFVGIGSQSEYGDFEEKVDEQFPVNPKTAYAAVKVACLSMQKCFCEIHGIEWYWFRLFPVFGPYETDRWLIPSLIRNMLTTQSMDLTLGEQRLSYLYVGESAKAVEMAIKAEGKSGIYNVCSDNPMPLKDLVTLIRDKVNPDFRLNFGALPYRYGQSMYMEGDTTALRKHIYQLNTSDFIERLDETIDYYRKLYANGQR